jgi:hypothetical protein
VIEVVHALSDATRFRARHMGTRMWVFVFFSNQLGCLPSLLISAGITLVLLLLFGVIEP